MTEIARGNVSATALALFSVQTPVKHPFVGRPGLFAIAPATDSLSNFASASCDRDDGFADALSQLADEVP